MAPLPGFDVDVREERREEVVIGQRCRTAQVEVELAADAPVADFRANNIRPDECVPGGDTELFAGNARQTRNTVECDAPRDEPVGVVHRATYQHRMRNELHTALFRRLGFLFSKW